MTEPAGIEYALQVETEAEVIPGPDPSGEVKQDQEDEQV